MGRLHPRWDRRADPYFRRRDLRDHINADGQDLPNAGRACGGSHGCCGHRAGPSSHSSRWKMHGLSRDNLAGKMMADDPVFARLWATNLTRGKGGVGASYTDADYARAIRYGVRSNGKPLIFMPAEAYYHFNDSDLGAIIAYLKSVPPVDQVTPRPSIGPIARTLSVLTPFPLLPVRLINRDAPRPAPVATGVTIEYGDYLLKAGGCTSCHNPNLSGGEAIQGVKVPNLTRAGIGSWSEADFTKALRTGVRPDGRILSAVMPWPYTRYLTDEEIRAMWMYLQSLPARPTGE